MRLNHAVSLRLSQLLNEKQMTQYQLFIRSGVPKSTIHNVLHENYQTVRLGILHELCPGLDIDLSDFFASPLFKEEYLEP